MTKINVHLISFAWSWSVHKVLLKTKNKNMLVFLELLRFSNMQLLIVLNILHVLTWWWLRHLTVGLNVYMFINCFISSNNSKRICSNIWITPHCRMPFHNICSWQNWVALQTSYFDVIYVLCFMYSYIKYGIVFHLRNCCNGQWVPNKVVRPL